MSASIPLFKVHMPSGAAPALAATLASGQLALGAKVEAFERGLADYTGNPRVNAMSDVSGALTLALYIAGVRPGDEVVVSPMVCLATSMPIANLFARPVWCDVDPATGMLDPARIAGLVTPRTRAILAYHWSGDVADIEALQTAARGFGLPLIEDASEAFGAEYRGRKLGDHGSEFCIYSFAAVRQITTGEGAALFCASEQTHGQARQLRRYGIHQAGFRLPSGDLNPESDIAVPGFNFCMNNIAASIGLTQLPEAAGIVERQRDNGRYYDSALADIAGITPLARRADAVSGYWTYSLRAERRADLMRKLQQDGIGCQRLHVRNDRYSCFAQQRRDDALPGVDLFDRENLSIPCGWWLTHEERERVVACIRAGW
ncbi:MAG: DegT/DnrJ/EryC1/StrS family aminotransferase [Burkholderiales bacterium]|nr:DegT/DnrJ/EryC1/StrS family aminotransferase [Burkholderiales bacterium]